VKIYVAGGSDERLTVVRPYIDRLIAIGHVITHDWTRCEGYERRPLEHEYSEWAAADLIGVEIADVFWLLACESKSEGSHAELGAALVLDKRVIVSGPKARAWGRIFTRLASEIHDSHEAAFRVLDLAGEDRR
jgi:hypothetical protein